MNFSIIANIQYSVIFRKSAMIVTINFVTWSTTELQDILQHLPECLPLSQVPVYQIW